MDFFAASFRVVISTPDGRGCPCSHPSALKVTSSHSSFCEPHTVSRNTSAKMVAQPSRIVPLHGTGQELSSFSSGLTRIVAKVLLNCQLPSACWREIRAVCLSDVVLGFSLTKSATSIALRLLPWLFCRVVFKSALNESGQPKLLWGPCFILRFFPTPPPLLPPFSN